MQNKGILFVGDIFSNLKDIPEFRFDEAYAVVYNQECVIGEKKELEPSEDTVNLISNEIVAEKIFNNFLFKFANISNNHIHDYGADGVERTILNLNSANINPFGEEIITQSETYYTLSDFKVCFLGFYMQAFASGEEKNRVKDIVKQSINKAVSNNATVFVIFHFGNEHYPYASSEQKEVAHIAIDSGAELVIGHHSHCCQNAEIYKNKYIFYSLGNFYFPNFINDAYWKDGRSKAKFVWRNASWTKKGIAVLYDLESKNIITYKTKFSNNKILIKPLKKERLLKEKSEKYNAIVGELRKMYLFLKWNVGVEKKIIYINGIKHKLESVKKNGRFSTIARKILNKKVI